MSDTFFELIFVVAIGLLLITPPVLILYGVYKKAENKGFLCFMIGASCYAVLIVILLTPYVCKILSQILYILGIDATFQKTEIVEIPLGILSIYGCYRLYKLIGLFSGYKRRYMKYALYCVRKYQDSSLPSCEEIIKTVLSESLVKAGVDIRINTQKKAEMAVYRIALSAVDSANYRNLFGMLDSTGEQFLHICRSLLDHFLSAGYVTQDEYENHSSYLTDCDLNFERYGLYP